MHQGTEQVDGGHQYGPELLVQALFVFKLSILILHENIGNNYLQKRRGVKEL